MKQPVRIEELYCRVNYALNIFIRSGPTLPTAVAIIFNQMFGLVEGKKDKMK